MMTMAERLKAALADRYLLERELGEGGMATVYLAQDVKQHRQVAVKVLKPELAAVIGAERFLQEIHVTAHLQHPHILPLFDSGEADSFLFYVMPYLEGESLRDRLNREKQLLIDFLCASAGGPMYYRGRDMVLTHRGMRISESDWNVFLGHAAATLAKFQVPEAEQRDVVAFVQSLKKQIVE
jgi:hypothetical protein